jgi:hypothetical protein
VAGTCAASSSFCVEVTIVARLSRPADPTAHELLDLAADVAAAIVAAAPPDAPATAGAERDPGEVRGEQAST